MYFTELNGLKFSRREIDVIACVVHSRGAKKMACMLGISPRTVEGYIRNILLKIGKNSQESIRDFAEDAPELNLLREHYVNLRMGQQTSTTSRS
ncbi:MAG: hypothetical protein HRU36_03015 [Rickettsiales bacterium]|nr:hypothetical protein [Rickettsiales bacterium]